MTRRLRHIILLTILTLGFKKIFSQRQFPEPADLKVSSLKKNKVDTIILYHHYYNGGDNHFYKKRDANCRPTYVRIVFWVKNGQYFKQKFDHCKDYPKQKLNQSAFIKLSMDSLNKIKINEIEPVSYTHLDKDGKQLTTMCRVSHSEITKFTFFINKISFSKIIDHFDIETDKTNDGYDNENYQINQTSILKRLMDSVTKEL